MKKGFHTPAHRGWHGTDIIGLVSCLFGWQTLRKLHIAHWETANISIPLANSLTHKIPCCVTGYERVGHYGGAEAVNLVFLDIANIHVVRSSMQAVCCTKHVGMIFVWTAFMLLISIGIRPLGKGSLPHVISHSRYCVALLIGDLARNTTYERLYL